MGKPITIHEFNLTIYPRKLWVIKKPTKLFLLENFEHSDGTPIELGDLTDYRAAVYQKCRFVQSRKLGSLVVLCEKLTPRDVAHEAVHVALDILDDLGVFVDPSNQEPFAYLVGFVADCIHQVNTKKN